MSEVMGIIRQTTFADVSPEYKAFTEKFKAKHTTDDCYTPENIYAAVLAWAAKRYGFNPSDAVRPFYPGGDYEAFSYAPNAVVVDNPPFSILAAIVRWYNRNRVRYFLFAPALTTFTAAGEANAVCVGYSITYANGAKVNTSFVTNMGDYAAETAPDLRDIIKAEDERNRNESVKELPKYEYPSAVISAAAMNYLACHHTRFAVRRADCTFIRKMDVQADGDKTIFGGGYLLSERAAAERAAAERAAAERAAAERAAAHTWQLSEREKAIQRMLGKRTTSGLTTADAVEAEIAAKAGRKEAK